MKPRPRNEHRDYAYRPPRRETGEEESASGALHLLAQFTRRYIGPHKWQLALCILLVSANTCSVFLMAYYGRIVVDSILVVSPPDDVAPTAMRDAQSVTTRDHALTTRPATVVGAVSEASQSSHASRRPPGAMLRLMTIFVLYLCTLVVLNIAARMAQALRIRISCLLTGALREDLHEKLLSLSQSYHTASTPGRLMSRVLSDVSVVDRQMMRTLVDASSFTLMFLVGGTLLAVLEWRIAVAVLLVMVPYSITIRRMHSRVRHVNREIRHTNACLYGLISQKMDSVRAIFAYGRERREFLTFRRLASSLLRDTLVQQRLGANMNRSAQVITSVTTVLIFVYCTRQVMDGAMTLGKMMYIYGTAANLFTPVLGLTQMSLMVSSLLVVLQRLTHVLQEPVEVDESKDAVDIAVPLRSGIAVQNVSFGYDPEAEHVLKGIHMDIPAGKWVCITGPSGSGKTTLLSLLARLYDPTNGNILVDGEPLHHVRFSSLRERVAVVPQEAQIFSGTVRDNITYGHPHAEPTDIMAAAKAAECHDFIMELPVKYETTIGEKGATLSGGQRQRISIARALLSRPDMLLLDDCTSALDADTERRIQETLARLMAGKTAVIVSQRVSMASRCDRIYVLEQGMVSESGTHEELVLRDGCYARQVKQQTG